MTAEYARRAGVFAFIALGLAIPISTAASNVLAGLLLVAWLAALPSSLRDARATIVATPPVAAAVALFAALLAGCLYGEAPMKESAASLSKYLDLALVPAIAWAAADPHVRKRALVCFGIAVVASLYVSYSAALGLPGLRNPEYPIGFKASVTHSIVVALAAFLFLLAARETAGLRRRIALVALAALCAHNVLFIVIGKTGYLVLALLLAAFVVVTLRGWRGPVLALAGCAALLAAAYLTAPNFRDRMNAAGSEISSLRSGEGHGTSLVHRLEYARRTLQIVSEHPWTGVGTGGFARAYAARAQGTPLPATTNPHNDYLLIAAQIGVGGVALVVALYVSLWMSAGKLGTPLYRDLARGLVLTMAIGGLFNSLLFDHTEGMLFAWLAALVCAAYRRTPRPAAAGAGEAGASGTMR